MRNQTGIWSLTAALLLPQLATAADAIKSTDLAWDTSGDWTRSSHFQVQSFEAQRDLPSRLPDDIFELPDGRIWITTQGGAAWWDGHQIKAVSNAQGYANYLRNLAYAVSPDGSVVGASRTEGVVLVDSSTGRYEAVEVGLEKFGRNVNGLFPFGWPETHDGRVWVLWKTDGGSLFFPELTLFDPVTGEAEHFARKGKGLGRVADNVREIFPAGTDQLDVMTVVHVGDETWMVVRGYGVMRFSANYQLMQVYDFEGGGIPFPVPMMMDFHSKSGKVFLSSKPTSSGGHVPLAVFDETLDRFVPLDEVYTYSLTAEEREALSTRVVDEFFEASDGWFYIASSEGLAVLRPDGRIEPIALTPAAEGNGYNLFSESSDGTVWYGWESLVQIRRTPFEVIPSSVFDGRMIVSVYEDEQNGLWIGTSDGLFYREPGARSVEQIGSGSGFDGGLGAVPTLFEYRGKILAGSGSYDGLQIVDPINKTVEKVSADSAHILRPLSNIVSDVFVDSRGRAWITSLYDGLVMIDQDGERHEFPSTGQAADFSSFQYGMREYSNGDLFVEGFDQLRLYEEAFDTFGPSLISDITMAGAHRDADGVFWVSSMDKGFLRTPRKKRSPDDSENIDVIELAGVFGQQIQDVRPGVEGSLVLTSNYGLAIYYPETEEAMVLGEEDGLPALEFHAQSFGLMNDGRHAYGNEGGVVIFNPAHIGERELSGPPSVYEVRFGTEVQDLDISSPSITLPVGTRDFSVRYTSKQHMVGRRLQYRYRLQGRGEEWSTWSSENVARWTSLEPGEYSLRLQYRVSQVKAPSPILEIPVTVVPQFFETLVGKVLIWVAVLAIACTFIYLYMRNRQRRVLEIRIEEAVREHRLAEERAWALTRDSHHMAKNGLSLSIRFIQQLAKRVKSAHSDTVSSDAVLSGLKTLEDQHYGMATLQNLLHKPGAISSVSMQEYFEGVVGHLVNTRMQEGEPVSYTVDCGDIEAEMRRMRDYGVIVVELVTNALKHAFPEHADDARISVAATCADGYITIVVEDNGGGLPEGFDLKSYTDGGLGIIQLIADQELGELTAASEAGVTRFAVRMRNDS